MRKTAMEYEEGGYTPRDTKSSATAAIDDQMGSTVTTHPKRAGMVKSLMDRGPEKTMGKTAPTIAAAKSPPKPDQFAEIRADLMANAKADAAAKAMAERKRKDAEAFSAKLKGATKKGSNKTGYDAYKSLMGE
jgi:hypothetical protein